MNSIREIYYVTVNCAVAYRYEYYAKDCAPAGARPLTSHTGRTINKVHQADGSCRTAYMYGEKAWSYSIAEVEKYRAEQNAKRAESAKRNALLKTISQHYENMTIEQLEKIVATL
jgi:hypothetical protein